MGHVQGHPHCRRRPRRNRERVVHLDRQGGLRQPARPGRSAGRRRRQCLDDPSGKTANGTHIDLSSCTGKANQRWTAVQDGTLRTGGKSWRRSERHRKRGQAPAGAVQFRRRRSAVAGRRRRALVNPQSGKCLDVPAASAANGTQPVIEPCANSASQPNSTGSARPPPSRPASPANASEPPAPRRCW